jgi:hypothetical protein
VLLKSGLDVHYYDYDRIIFFIELTHDTSRATHLKMFRSTSNKLVCLSLSNTFTLYRTGLQIFHSNGKCHHCPKTFDKS